MRHPIISILVLLTVGTAYGRGLRGKVTEADSGEPLAYATIVANPGNHVALTDADGAWQLNLQDGRYTIVVSYIGWLNDTLSVMSPSSKPLDVRLRQSACLV